MKVQIWAENGSFENTLLVVDVESPADVRRHLKGT